MDITTAVGLAILALLLYFILRPSPLPGIPGPSLRDYLPGGITHCMYADPGSTLETVTELMRVHGTVFQMWLGPTRTVFLSDPADLVHVVSTEDDFDRPASMITAFDAAMPSSILSMPRDEHFTARRRLRENFNHALLPSFHAPILDAIAEIASELRASAIAQRAAANPQPVDINNVLSTATTRVILNVALGGDMQLAERKAFAQDMDHLIRELLDELMQYPVRQALAVLGTRARLVRYRRSVEAVARRLVERRVAEPAPARAARAPDLLDAILALDAHDTPRRVAQVSAFVVAGAHTVSIGVTYALLHLCTNARARAALEAEVDGVVARRAHGAPAALTHAEVCGMDYLEKVWKETLRLTPPAAGAMRRARRTVTLRGTGTRLPAGTQVDALFRFAQTSERFYDDAARFVPERWGTSDAPGEADRAPAGAYMPFGAGPRACAGRFLAEYEGRLMLGELVRCFKFELACPAEEIRNVTGLNEAPRWSSKRDGKLDMGVPMLVRER